jgi:dTDP-glucose 4,6-dehydratase
MSVSKTKCPAILITGGAGFIGSNFIPYFLAANEDYRLINVDKLTYAGRLDNLREVEKHLRYMFIKGDICDRKLVENIFNVHDIRGVVNFAAETHVDNSIFGPDVFINTNIVGTFTLLEVARDKWMEVPHRCRAGYEKCRFHQISTDEVYGSLGPSGYFTEETPYAPSSPYSASKSAADMLVRSYHYTYGLNVVTSNCSNNYGPGQHDEKLIPTIIRKALSLKKIPIYGNGKNIRDWLYVGDHCKAVDLVFHQGNAGETYNIGGRNERDNLSLAKTLCGILDEMAPQFKRNSSINSFCELIEFVEDRPGHDRRYAIDPAKIEKSIGWHAAEDFKTGLRKTVEWYLKYHHCPTNA